MSKLDALIANFSNKNLDNFLYNALGSFTPSKETFTGVVDEERFNDPIKIGEARLEDQNDLLVFTCKSLKDLTRRSSKKQQFDIAKKLLGRDFKNGAIFVFYDDEGRFRLSFVRRYYGSDQKFTNWRRFTYFITPEKNNKTFRKRFGKCRFESLDAIEQSFAIEELSKEFYEKLSHWYFAALQEVSFPNDLKEDDDEHHAQSLIRLITRMIFVWFMREKGLIPAEIFDKDYVNSILVEKDKRDKTGSTYYKAILQNLFFATLNTEMGDGRKWLTSSAYGVPTFYRYKRFFTASGADEFLNLMRTVPYLNGGLFENLDIVETADPERGTPKRDARIDCFSDNKRNEGRLKVPDYLFFGERTANIANFLSTKKKAAPVKVEGLIDLLKRYDFTIDENSQHDQEVALDPELLGTVFENLLASYNPETKKTARKESGSFYTPRLIVDYMVKESLFYHLQARCDIDDNLLRELIEADSSEEVPEELNFDDKQALVQAITHITILDPACGSGAFPMGALQHMVRLLSVLDPTNQVFKEKLQQKRKEELRTAIDHSDYNELKANIDEIFANEANDADYARKLYLIRDCLYGVDIQPIAVQITKLRFFISLLVDQEPKDHEVNRGIMPLPNLETKFIAANTLVGLPSVEGVLPNLHIQELEQKLADVRQRHFNARTTKTKRKYRAEDQRLRRTIAAELRDSGWANDTAIKVSQWDPFDRNASSDWFDPEWMFGIKDGFDVVIGNPPYINTKRGIDESQKSYYKKHYKTAVGQFDLFCLFVERSREISKLYSFIVPRPIINNKSYENLRMMMTADGLSVLVVGSEIFEGANVESCIFLVDKAARSNVVDVLVYERGVFQHKLTSEVDVSELLPHQSFNINIESNDVSILRKIRRNSINLEQIASVARGVECGKNSDLITQGDGGGDNQYKLLRGEDLSRYKAQFAGYYLTTDFNKPSLYKQADLYEGSKILIRRVTNVLTASYINEFLMVLNTIYIVKSGKVDVDKYILAFLNSNLMRYYFHLKFSNEDKVFPYIRAYQLKSLPINVSHNAIEWLACCVDEILERKINKLDTNNLERMIDVAIYKIYELTYDEVCIVDPDFWLTEAKYNAYELPSAE